MSEFNFLTLAWWQLCIFIMRQVKFNSYLHPSSKDFLTASIAIGPRSDFFSCCWEFHLTSIRIASFCIISLRIMLDRILSDHIMSERIMSDHIMSFYIIPLSKGTVNKIWTVSSDHQQWLSIQTASSDCQLRLSVETVSSDSQFRLSAQTVSEDCQFSYQFWLSIQIVTSDC